MSRKTVAAAITAFCKAGWIREEPNGRWRVQDFEHWVAPGRKSLGRTSCARFPGPVSFSQAPAQNAQGGGAKVAGENRATPEARLNAVAEKRQRKQRKLPRHLQWTILKDGADAADTYNNDKETTNNTVVEAAFDSSSIDRQRPETAAKQALPSGVAVEFASAIGRPLDRFDEAALADLRASGVTDEEVTRAIGHFARSKAQQMVRAGLRYITPMLKSGMFRPGAPAPRSCGLPQAPSGIVTIGHTPDLIAWRRAQRLARLKNQEP